MRGSFAPFAWLAALVAVGCSPPHAAPSSDAVTPTGARHQPSSPDLLPLDAPRTHLLLQRHNYEDSRAHLLPVALSDGALLPRMEVPAIGNSVAPARFSFSAVHGGGLAWASAERSGQGFVLRVRRLGANAEREVALPERPAALLLASETVLVGIKAAVGQIDLAEAAPVWREVRRRQEMDGKAYDLFVRAGSWLLAIDDVVSPVYADSFGLDPRGRPAHAQAWMLPGIINGEYRHAVLRPTGKRDGVLYTVTPYGILSGHGQDLTALAIVNDRLTVPNSFVINSQRSVTPPVLEEHVTRTTGKPEKLAAGDKFTPWNGLALRGEHLLLAAGARGLLVVPVGFTPDTRADAVDLGGDCLDVLSEAGRTWALVGGPSPALVTLTGDGNKLSVASRTPLPGRFDRFVR